MALSAGTRLGTYEILAPIGAGGMGTVDLAHTAGSDGRENLLPAQLGTLLKRHPTSADGNIAVLSKEHCHEKASCRCLERSLVACRRPF